MTAFIDFAHLPTGQAKVAEAACKVLLEHSERPHAGNIVELGYITPTTSKTTITNGIDGFWSALSRSINTWMHIPKIPLELEATIVSIYKDLNTQAESRFNEQAGELSNVILSLRTELKDTKQTNTALKDDLSLANEKLKNHIQNDQDNVKIMTRQAEEINEIRLERNAIEHEFTNSTHKIKELEDRIVVNEASHNKVLEKEETRYEHNDTLHINRNDKLAIEIKKLNIKIDTLTSGHKKEVNAAAHKCEQLSSANNKMALAEKDLSGRLKHAEKNNTLVTTERDAEKKSSAALNQKLAKQLQENEKSRITGAEQSELIKQLEVTTKSQQSTNDALLKQLESLTRLVDKLTTPSTPHKKNKS